MTTGDQPPQTDQAAGSDAAPDDLGLPQLPDHRVNSSGDGWIADQDRLRDVNSSATPTERALGASTLQGANATVPEVTRQAMADVVASESESGR